jgi:hypothetical protein
MQINWNPNPVALRRWAILVGVTTCIIGTLLFFFGDQWFSHSRFFAYKIWGIGLTCFVTGIIGGKIGLWVYRAWMTVALTINRILSFILLAFIYYSLLTFMGCISRLFGRDKLQMHLSKKTSYWRKIQNSDATGLEKQF